jgi:hypothetical protein
MTGGDDCEAISEMNQQLGKPKYAEQTCPSTALSTTDSTLLDLGSNPGLRSGKVAINHLSYDMALVEACWGFLIPSSKLRHSNLL